MCYLYAPMHMHMHVHMHARRTTALARSAARVQSELRGEEARRAQT